MVEVRNTAGMRGLTREYFGPFSERLGFKVSALRASEFQRSGLSILEFKLLGFKT